MANVTMEYNKAYREGRTVDRDKIGRLARDYTRAGFPVDVARLEDMLKRENTAFNLARYATDNVQNSDAITRAVTDHPISQGR
jgi:hypothetical protein